MRSIPCEGMVWSVERLPGAQSHIPLRAPCRSSAVEQDGSGAEGDRDGRARLRALDLRCAGGIRLWLTHGVRLVDVPIAGPKRRSSFLCASKERTLRPRQDGEFAGAAGRCPVLWPLQV